MEVSRREDGILAVIVELDNGGTYTRYALTLGDFHNKFEKYLKEGMPEPSYDGQTFTLRLFTHIWYQAVKINSCEWQEFFTDMEDGLPHSDIAAGNYASVSKEMTTSCLIKYIPDLQEEHKMNIFEKWAHGELSMLCYSEDECREFLSYVHEQGIRYAGCESLLDKTYWGHGQKCRGYNCCKHGHRHAVTTFDMDNQFSDDERYCLLPQSVDFANFWNGEIEPSINVEDFEAILMGN